WITGRVDDVINVAGHRMGTAEVESALVAHQAVSEAAVVGYPHDIKGQGIYAYVTLMTGVQPTEELRKELVQWVRKEIGPIYWITGRVDDVINVAGHRMGTAEVESALVAHQAVSEAAVVGYPHDIKGQGIYAYVTLMTGVQPTEELRKELVQWVRKEIGPIA